jgi:hypothetical protein
VRTWIELAVSAKRAAWLAIVLAAIPAFGQAPAQPSVQNENRLHRDFRVEGQSLAASCGKFSFGNLIDCGQTLVTGQPMHIAFGSLAPQNGTGFGLAFVEHKNFADEWRLNWDVDAVAATSESWRAGAYMKAYRLSGGTIHMEFPSAGSTAKHSSAPLFNSAPLINVYSESDSLNRVDYFGLGPDSLPANHTTYGFTENITGVSAIAGVHGALTAARVSLVGEINGRFPSLRPGNDSTIPSVGSVFTEVTAPGLTHPSAFFEPSEGLRLEPALFKDLVRLNYLIQFQQFVAVGDDTSSFRRFNADFNHEIPLYRVVGSKLGKLYYKNRAADLGYNGPDDCTGGSVGQNISIKRAAAAKSDPASPCPIVSTTENLEGSITLRLFLSESFAKAGGAVPFYLSPTLGGSDINGAAALASYPDYRFRGPDLLLLRGTFEHSLGKLPLGALFSVDQGKVGLRRDDIDFDHLRHTFSAGVTVHAGGLPVMYLIFAWGGNEGNHTTATISPTLLGGSARPSLF